MVHQRQSLPFGFEPGDDRFGVHAQLDDFEGDAAADGLLLFGHIDHAAAAFADLLQQFVVADAVAGLFGQRRGKDDGFAGQRGGWLLKETAGLFVRLEEGFNLLAQLGIIATGLGEVGGTFSRVCLLQGIGENLFNQFVVVCIHKRTVFNRGRPEPPQLSRPRPTSASFLQPVMRHFEPGCATR